MNGKTALILASEHNHLDVARLLLVHRVDVTIRDGHDELALDIARRKNHAEIVELLETHQSSQ